MLQRDFLRRLKPHALFLGVYTVVFLLFRAALPFTLPFLAGLLLAVLLHPLRRLLQSRLRLRPGAAAAFATASVYLTFFGLLFWLLFWLATELSSLALRLPSMDLGVLAGPLHALLERIGGFPPDTALLAQNERQLLSFLQSGVSVLSAVLGGTLSFLTSLPAVLTMLVVLVMSTYFFSRDLDALRARLLSLLSERGAACLREASRHGAALSGRWAASYLLLCALTALETLLLFSLLGLPYPLLLSLLAGIADLLPILGPGLVYLPAAALTLLCGNWPGAAALLLGWVLICAVRQIIEPKLVSSLVRIHPLAMLAALYGSLVAQSLWLLLYCLTLFLLHQILTKSGVLPPLFPEDTTASGAPSGFSSHPGNLRKSKHPRRD